MPLSAPTPSCSCHICTCIKVTDTVTSQELRDDPNEVLCFIPEDTKARVVSQVPRLVNGTARPAWDLLPSPTPHSFKPKYADFLQILSVTIVPNVGHYPFPHLQIGLPCPSALPWPADLAPRIPPSYPHCFLSAPTSFLSPPTTPLTPFYIFPHPSTFGCTWHMCKGYTESGDLGVKPGSTYWLYCSVKY